MRIATFNLENLDDRPGRDPPFETRLPILRPQLERAVPHSQRFSVLHAGQALTLDHVLVSRPLLGLCRKVEIHNEGLGDEVVGYALAHGSPESFHAPVVAEFEL